MFQIIPQIGTVTALLAFIVAVVARTVTTSLNRQKSLIETAPPEDRVAQTERVLSELGIVFDTLSSEQKYQLAHVTLEQRLARFRMMVQLSIVLALIAAVTITITLTLRPVRGSDVQKAAKVLVVDSFIRRYDLSQTITNAHYITDFVKSCGDVIGKKVEPEHILVDKGYDRFDYILGKHPDLMIVHMSSFFESENKEIDPEAFSESMVRFQALLDYMLEADKKLRILVYTREIPEDGVWGAETHKLILDNLEEQKRFIEQRKDRVSLLMLPWNAKFSNPRVSKSTREKIRQLLLSL